MIKRWNSYNPSTGYLPQIGKVSGIIKNQLMIDEVTLLKVSMGLRNRANVVFVFQRNTTYFTSLRFTTTSSRIQRINPEEYSPALEHYQEALKIVRGAADSFRESSILGDLGLLYEGLTEYSNAIDCFQQAIRLTQQVGDKRAEGIHLGNLATIYKKIGQYEKGAEIYKQAVQIASEINDKRSTGIHLGNLGNLYYFLDKFDEAMGFLTRCRDCARIR